MVLASVAASLVLGVSAQAAVSKKEIKTTKKTVVTKTAAAAPAAAVKKSVSRDIRFNGSQVDGKYLSAGESIAEVEGEKEMSSLIGIRKNFRDRLKDEKARLQAATSGKGQ